MTAPAVSYSYQQSVSWLPVSRTDLTPLPALATCYVNTVAGCDFHKERKQEEYLRAWRYPAPPHCRRGVPAVVSPPIPADRLGIEYDCNRMTPL